MLLGCLLTAFATSPRAAAQENWNGARVLDLVTRARAARQSVAIDTAFTSYRGDARGYVYFFIDRPDTDERTLVKADQIALEVFWQAPNLTRQRIVGLRDEKVLPTSIRYHLDHLTVVQDDFGDFIRLGDGDEVEQVLHPAGPDSHEHYDFLLSDSLSISYGGGAEEVRVYEVRVRPRDHDAPGFIGSVYLDRATAAIVRMSFTFTPASYVDPYLDYIRISLDNSLWDGRYWLPYRQEAELRRELPVLDFLAGSIIRGRFEIGPYDFNVDTPPFVLTSRRVTAVPEAERRAFPFETGLFEDLRAKGLAPSPAIEDIREQAAQMVRERYLSGLAPRRLHVGSASDVLRYNRAEGLFVGAGFALRRAGDAVVRTAGGFAVGRGKWSGSLTATGGPGPVVPTLEAYWDQPRDLGQRAGVSGAMNTLTLALGRRDYSDLYFARGASVGLAGRRPESTRLTLRLERHESATNVIDDVPTAPSRPVREVDEGMLGALSLVRPLRLPYDGVGEVIATLGRLGPETFGSAQGEVRWTVESTDDAWRVDLTASAGGVTPGAPAQALFLLGGRGTLPGHVYRHFVGDRFWLASGEATLPLIGPWLGLRAFGAVGATYLRDGREPPRWDAGGSFGLLDMSGVRDSGGVRGSLGVGLSVGWDVLRLDLARSVRGIDRNRWEWIVSVTPRFRKWL